MRLTTLTATLIMTLTAPPQTPPSPANLDQMHDRYRPILIFAADSDPRLGQQVDSLLAHRSDLIERQIILVPFFHKYAGAVDGEIITFLSQEEPALRKRFHVAPTDFTVILLGKDGAEKLRSSKPVSFDKLRDKIDAMPMRKQEMHKSIQFR